MSISIIDYGRGNLRSVQKAFETVGHEAQIISRAQDIERAERLVLPGQGAFKDCMATLEGQGMVAPLRSYLASGRPYLGLCLGLQILFDWSEEHGGAEGLGVVAGKVPRFVSPLRGENGEHLKVPHMGWNAVEFVGDQPLFGGIESGTYFYFVHSYYVAPEDGSVAAARTRYGIDFVSAIRKGPIMATQFHPEKSQKAGLSVIKNFCELSGEA
ncbi:MAG: imidazole glycerol phosphate synthase subunit HisH [Chrysiogenetes bacterium]|nr:imidazole glycerol phosphate synthase subunit HisH [Chrysiogenetes bacterium]